MGHLLGRVWIFPHWNAQEQPRHRDVMCVGCAKDKLDSFLRDFFSFILINKPLFFRFLFCCLRRRTIAFICLQNGANFQKYAHRCIATECPNKFGKVPLKRPFSFCSFPTLFGHPVHYLTLTHSQPKQLDSWENPPLQLQHLVQHYEQFQRHRLLNWVKTGNDVVG